MAGEVRDAVGWVRAEVDLKDSFVLTVQNSAGGQIQCYLTARSRPDDPATEVSLPEATLDFLRRLIEGRGTYRHADYPAVSRNPTFDCSRRIRDRLAWHLAELAPSVSEDGWRDVLKQVLRTQHGVGYVIDPDRLRVFAPSWPPERSTVPAGGWGAARLASRSAKLQPASVREKAEFVRQWAGDAGRSGGLGQYKFAVEGGDLIWTPMITRPDWCGLLHGAPLGPKQVKMVADLKGPSSWVPPDGLPALAARYAERLFADTRLENLPTYRLVELDLPRAVQFEVIDFYKYRFSTGLLEDEWTNRHLTHGGGAEFSDVRPEDVGKLRSLLLPDLDSLTDFRRRLCAGGVGTVFACNKEDTDLNVMLQVRGGSVSDGKGLHAVIPKAFHQPEVLEDHGRTVHGCTVENVHWTVLRELHEEVFGGDDPAKQGDPAVFRFDWFMSANPTMRWFQSNPS
ncbi:MAG: hypothetical protein K2V38_19090, partial [Gemmataceae bacterium]|nr:hypothetical protein [Gemmataceae bacterium]